MFAAESDSVLVLKLLLEKGANVESRDYRSNDATMHAAYAGASKCLEYLLDKGQKVDQRNKYRQTPLIMATSRNFDEMYEETPFADLQKLLYETVRVLIENGADVNAKDHEGMTALMFAIDNGYSDIVRLLLSKGADLKAKNSFGDSPKMFYHPNYETSEQMTELLNIEDPETEFTLKRLHQSDKDYNLYQAVLNNNLSEINYWLNAGGDLNYDDGQDEFALMRAVMANDYESVKFFMGKGANVNAKNTYNNAPIIFATKSGDVKMINLLVGFGADINILGNAGTPLYVAKSYNNIEAVKYLESLGAIDKSRD